MQHQSIATVERKVLVFVFCVGIDTQRKGRIKSHLAAVEKWWHMTGVGKGAMTQTVDPERERSSKATLHASDEPTVEPGENAGGIAVELGQCAHSAHNQSDVHGRLQSFAADVPKVPKDNQRSAILHGDDLEEVASDLMRGIVDARDGVAGNIGDGLRNQNPLDFARRFQLQLDACLSPALTSQVAQQRVGHSDEKQGVEYLENGDAGICHVKQRRAEPRRQRPVSKADTLAA